MSAGASVSGSSGRHSSVKQRGLHYLQRLKDVSKEIFRNLQTVAKTGRDEPGGAEKAETLRSQRENYIQLLCSFQGELHESVSDLDKVMECKKKMGGMKKKIQDHEDALKNFGQGLKSAEHLLSGVLKSTYHEGHCATSDEPVELDIDDLIRYSHVISYSTSAQEGWEPNTMLTGALPPAPHSEMMARSRLFSFAEGASRPSRLLEVDGGAAGRTCEGGHGGASDSGLAAGIDVQVGGGAGGLELKRKFEGRGDAEQCDEDDDMYKIWSHPLLPEDNALTEAADAHGDEMKRPQKRQAVVQQMSAYAPDIRGAGVDTKMRDSVDAIASENTIFNLRQDACIEIPKRPTWWRPGMPIVVGVPEK